MFESNARQKWRPTRTTFVAGALVIAGFWLAGVSWWFFLLVALGTFGPGLLREMGWLNDKDEFQRLADHRAGYHAFLATGLVAFVLVAFFRTGERAIPDTHNLAEFFLALLWVTWLFSSLLAFWGSQRAAAWMLRIFGSVVLVFTIVSNLGPEWTGWAALLLHPLLAAPFFVLAWTAGRWPRITGVLLLAVAAYFFVFFGGPRGHDMKVDTAMTLMLLLGPLLASGVALLTSGMKGEDPDDAEDALMAGE